MPYIAQKHRENVDPFINLLASRLYTKGDVNYAITKLVHLWILWEISQHNGKLSYEILSKGYDVLAEAAAEYYRRVLGNYEDKKRSNNGPVSDLDSPSLNEVM